jgi:hypothetical protein
MSTDGTAPKTGLAASRPPAERVPGALLALFLVARIALAEDASLVVTPRVVQEGEAARLELRFEGLVPRATPALDLPDDVVAVSGPVPLHVGGGAGGARGFVYWLAFARTGRCRIGPATVETDRGRRSTSAVTVTVREAGRERLLRVSASLERERAYVGQPVTATFEFAYSCRPERLVGFAVPFPCEIEGLETLDPDDLYARWHEEVMRTGRGLPGHRPMEVTGRGRPAVAAVSSREIDGRTATVWTVRRVLVPARAGRFEFGRAAAAARVVTGERRRLFRRPVPVVKVLTAVSESLSLEAVGLPREGRPDDFDGPVGRYDLRARAEPVEVALGGRPIELRFSLEGEGFVGPVGPPRLPETGEFRVGCAEEETSMRIEGGRLLGEKRFRLAVRPLSERMTVIPGAELAVFDPLEERYVVLRTEPIPVKVTAPSGGVDLSPPFGRDDLVSLDLVDEELAGIETGFDPSRSHAAWLHGSLVLPALGGAAGALYAALFVVSGRRKRRRPARPSPAQAARKALRELALEAGSMPDEELASRLARIVRGSVARRAAVRAAGITSAEAASLLREAGLSEECASEAAGLLEDIEAARFAGASLERGPLLERARACVDGLELERRTRDGERC